MVRPEVGLLPQRDVGQAVVVEVPDRARHAVVERAVGAPGRRGAEEVLERVADVLLRARFGRAREERRRCEDHRDPPHCPRW